jgi:hypothetical protein
VISALSFRPGNWATYVNTVGSKGPKNLLENEKKQHFPRIPLAGFSRNHGRAKNFLHCVVDKSAGWSVASTEIKTPSIQPRLQPAPGSFDLKGV